ncbi:MAG: ribonuclease E inhibitor RraB [Bacteroidota bacterium]
MDNTSELNAHFKRNEDMWQVWKEKGVDSKTELTVNFHFYSTRKENTELLCKILSDENIPHRVEKTRTLIFLKGWKIEADIKKNWTLPELQGKTGNMFILAEQTGVLLEGCGAVMSN